ncbi:baseplate J/gp47 family protein [Chengkuizengella marina]|nr:baseplate J/gp47 family protein [Chengkuizengella marina]
MKNRNEIHEEMLANISDDYDKTVGTFIYDATKPAAIEFENAYADLNRVEGKLSIENLEGVELEQRINERAGIERKPATNAVGYLLVEGNGEIANGDLFETGSGVQFESTETKAINGSDVVNIRSIEPGEVGNVPSNQITLVPVTISGITSINNPNPTADGFEAESDAELLERYYDKIQTPSTSGNKAHYINWAREVSGVGDARVFPLWDGDNTVKVMVIDSNMHPASQNIIDEVQQYIDPDVTGMGEGQAPIGAFATIDTATAIEVNIQFSVTTEVGYSEGDVIESVSNSISDYLQQIAFDEEYVSYAMIGNLVLTSEGVKDYLNLTVNGGANNISVSETEVAILGGVNIV